jgi:hypothetical protein
MRPAWPWVSWFVFGSRVVSLSEQQRAVLGNIIQLPVVGEWATELPEVDSYLYSIFKKRNWPARKSEVGGQKSESALLWVPRNDNEPKICPKCESPFWNRPRMNEKP